MEKVELRESKKVDLCKDVQIKHSDRPMTITLVNISLGGICFKSESPLKSQMIELPYTTLKGKEIILPAQILHESKDMEKQLYVYHCRFNNLLRQTLNLLEREIVDLQLIQIRMSR